MATAGPAATWADGAHRLATAEPMAAALLARHGLPRTRRPTPGPRRFEALARAIVHQQLAGSAAAAIWGRTVDAVGGVVTPAAVLATPVADLRAAGLSGAKVAAVVDLAAHVAEGSVRLERIGRRDDGEVVEHLTVVRGIGPWTAQMFLLFDLGRPDVWPTGDLGVRVGFGRAAGLEDAPSPTELEELGRPFAPYRSVMAWWCWREADTRTPATIRSEQG